MKSEISDFIFVPPASIMRFLLDVDGMSGVLSLLHAIAIAEPEGGLAGSGGFGWMLFETLLLLAAVCLLAYVVIRLLHRRLYGAGRSASDKRSKLRVVDRLALGPRRSIQVVRAGTKVLLVGVSENRIDLIDELNPDDWSDDGQEDTDHVVKGAFKRTLRDVLARQNEPSDDSPVDETAKETAKDAVGREP